MSPDSIDPLLCVALDDLAEQEAECLAAVTLLVEEVPESFGFKINLDYFLLRGIKAAVETLRAHGSRPLFADVKMWNGRRTMLSVVRQLIAAEVDYLNIYALAEKELKQAAEIAAGTKTKLLGLTVLTHYDEDYCQRHFRRSLGDTVRHFAEIALRNGCHGIVLPGTTLDRVADLDTIKAVPGVRPPWYIDTRHEQEVEPGTAVRKGARLLVCGSPIMKSLDKPEALRRVLAEMRDGLT